MNPPKTTTPATAKTGTYVTRIKFAESVNTYTESEMLAMDAIKHNFILRRFDDGTFGVNGYSEADLPPILVPMTNVRWWRDATPEQAKEIEARLAKWQREIAEIKRVRTEAEATFGQ